MCDLLLQQLDTKLLIDYMTTRQIISELSYLAALPTRRSIVLSVNQIAVLYAYLFCLC